MAPMRIQNLACNKRFALVCGLFFLQILCATAAAGAGFTLQQVMSSPFPSNLVSATHSPRVAWTFSAKGSRNIWIADAPEFAARQVTQFSGDDGQPLASLRITPDGRTLVFVKGSETNEAGRVADPLSGLETVKQQVWAIDADGGNLRMLGEMGCGEEGCEDVEISPDGQFAVWAARKQLWLAHISGMAAARQLTDFRGDNHSPRWSPDGRSIAFVSDRQDHSFIAIYDFGHNNVRYMAPTSSRDLMPRWAPHGKTIAFVRRPGVEGKLPLIPERPEPWAIWIADPVGGSAKEVWHSGMEMNDSFPAETEEVSFNFGAGDRILFGSEQDGWNHLYSVPAKGGTAVLLTPGKFEVEDVALSADQTSVLYSSNQDDVDRRHIWRVRLDGGAPNALSKGETMEWTPVEQSGQVLCLGSTATTPAMPYRLTSQGRQMLAPDALPKDFPSSQLVVPKQVIFKSEDGLEIHGQLFMPTGRTQPGPAVIFTHGGPIRQMMLGFHYMQYYHNAYAMNQYLASQGFVVLSVNYRLGIMYGRAFREAPNSSWRGSAEYKDVVAGAKYLQSLPTVDAKRIGLWGGSYGGLLTALGLARNSDIFASGVDLHGVHDWSVFIHSVATSASDGKEAEQLAFESSPNASISTWKSPVLLIHGDDDRNVPFQQTVDLAERLREHNVPYEELIFPDEIHDFLQWKHFIQAYTATADFFTRTLKKQ